MFVSLIYIKSDSKNLEKYKKYIFIDSLSFFEANKLLNKLVDQNLVSQKSETNLVFGDSYGEVKEKFQNGIKIKYDNNSIINSLTSGIVVFIGEKDGLGNTVIIQGIDGYDIWYSNIQNLNLTIYDYVEKGAVLGESEELIVTISKNGEYIEYDEYIKTV